MKRWMLLPLAIVIATLVGPRLGWAFYSTGYHAATENSAVIANKPNPLVSLVTVLNYDTSNPKVVMCFDAAALPGNGAWPIFPFPVPAATASNAPGAGSKGFPSIQLVNGLVCACSTTGKTLTVDTTSGGNCHFEVWP